MQECLVVFITRLTATWLRRRLLWWCKDWTNTAEAEWCRKNPDISQSQPLSSMQCSKMSFKRTLQIGDQKLTNITYLFLPNVCGLPFKCGMKVVLISGVRKRSESDGNLITPFFLALFWGASEFCACHKQKSGQDRNRQMIVGASLGKENG